MRHLVLLAAVYALVAALVLPSSLFAADDPPVPAADPAEAGEVVAPAPEAAAEAPAPSVAPAEAPAPPPAPSVAPAQTPADEPVPAPPPPQVLPDEQPDEAPVAEAAASASVTIRDFEFAPVTVTVNVGDTVTWNNVGPTAHSATASDGSFDTGVYPKGESRSQTFNEAGTFAYICTPHPVMKGTVVVQAASDDGGSESGSTESGSTDSGVTGGTESGSSSDSGPSLPASGMDAAAMAVLGLLMLVLGAAVRRRARVEDPRPAGRIGW
jgi:plastocyanin